MRDDGRTGPLTPGSGRMGSKDPAGISGCMVLITLARLASGSARLTVRRSRPSSGSVHRPDGWPGERAAFGE